MIRQQIAISLPEHMELEPKHVDEIRSKLRGLLTDTIIQQVEVDILTYRIDEEAIPPQIDAFGDDEGNAVVDFFFGAGCITLTLRPGYEYNFTVVNRIMYVEKLRLQREGAAQK